MLRGKHPSNRVKPHPTLNFITYKIPIATDLRNRYANANNHPAKIRVSISLEYGREGCFLVLQLKTKSMSTTRVPPPRMNELMSPRCRASEGIVKRIPMKKAQAKNDTAEKVAYFCVPCPHLRPPFYFSI